MKKRTAGFSLVEMLVTIAVIGVISAIAIPHAIRIDERAAEASARRNAQQAASLSASANVLGINHVSSDADGGVKATLELLSNGIDKIDNSGILVRLNLSEDEIEKASKFLTVKDHASYFQLVYLGTS